MLRIRGLIATVGLLHFTLSAHAADKPGSQDHPLVSRFPGATIKDFATTKFDATQFPIKAIPSYDPSNPPAEDIVGVEGKITYINYIIPADTSTLEVERNYEQAMNAKGFRNVYSCPSNTDTNCLGVGAFVVNSGKAMKTGFGNANFANHNRYLLARRDSAAGTVYVMVYVMEGTSPGRDGSMDLEIVEIQGMQSGQVTVADAAALAHGLEQDGKVAVYGIYFDTARAELKPDSTAELKQMALLLAASPALKVYIVGHTDNQGTLAGNLDLSQRRADSVVRSLESDYHVDARRIEGRGVGSLAPVANNGQESGRALNRRVELVLQ